MRVWLNAEETQLTTPAYIYFTLCSLFKYSLYTHLPQHQHSLLPSSSLPGSAKMEARTTRRAFLWAAFAALLSQNLVVHVVSRPERLDDQKTYYTPDPNAPTPPTGTNL